jgi:hypothetical protein
LGLIRGYSRIASAIRGAVNVLVRLGVQSHSGGI